MNDSGLNGDFSDYIQTDEEESESGDVRNWAHF